MKLARFVELVTYTPSPLTFLISQTFILNLSAPFIPQFFGNQVSQILPFTDVVIGNEAEAESWATANGYPNVKDLPGIAKAIAILPKNNPARPRVVVFTQGAQSTVLVTSEKPDSPQIFPVHALTDDQIIDTNGAGDAFAGGFIGALVAGKNLEEAVEAGHKLGGMCVQQVSNLTVYHITLFPTSFTSQVGPQYKWPKIQIL